jgi:hypothetical protein
MLLFYVLQDWSFLPEGLAGEMYDCSMPGVLLPIAQTEN